ncbi:16047_t:CDS:2 [Funneliformis geosporum]|uniref:16047_t:CDS:1 n=1 Tax=Funneliformis geosporum TaxID=1117311 RepID=A0A9W4WV12_9GLOM|nr:16047_t:CDS:2 [Funneliformis geosporum]
MVKDQDKDERAAFNSFIFNTTNEVLNSISIVSACFVVCTISYLRINRKSLANRVSFRLQAYVSMTDLLFSAFQIMMVNSSPPGNWVCHVAPWGFVFTSLLSLFLTVALTFNLQIIFVHNYMHTKKFEKYYVMIPFFSSFILSILPVLFDALGFDEKEISCWYKHGNTTNSVIWQWTTLHGWIILSIGYCITSVLLIIYRLRTVNNQSYISNDIMSTDTNKRFSQSRIRQQLLINRAVQRIVLYPIIPIICFSFNIIATLVFYIRQENYFPVQMASNVGTSSQGTLNALVFCFDPIMKHVWTEIAEKWFKVDDKVVKKSGGESGEGGEGEPESRYGYDIVTLL